MAGTNDKNRTKGKQQQQQQQQQGGGEQSRGGQTAPVPYRRGGGLAPYGTWDPFGRMFEEFFRGWPALWQGGRNGHWGLDVQEDDNQVVVRAEAPGFEPGDFDLQVRGDQLVMSARHEAEEKEEKGGYRSWQQREFYHAVTLPAGTNPDKVDAEYHNGLLTVTLPKTEAAKARKISVRGGSGGER